MSRPTFYHKKATQVECKAFLKYKRILGLTFLTGLYISFYFQVQIFSPIPIGNSTICAFSFFMAFFIVQLLKNSLMLSKIINHTAHRNIFTVLFKKMIVLDLKLYNLFLKLIKLYYTHVNKFSKGGEIVSRFLKKFCIIFL